MVALELTSSSINNYTKENITSIGTQIEAYLRDFGTYADKGSNLAFLFGVCLSLLNRNLTLTGHRTLPSLVRLSVETDFRI